MKDLHELADFDWESFLAKRVSQPQDALPLEVVGRCGYRIRVCDRAPREQISRQNRGGGGGVSARDSLGLTFSGEGRSSMSSPAWSATGPAWRPA